MKILIADDHALFLKGLEMILSDFTKDVELVTANDYTEVFAAIEKHKDLNLILTDLAMPGARWLDALEKIHAEMPDVPIIILSAVFDREIVQKSFDLGAAGYIPKTSSNAVILSAVNLVLSGGVYIPSELLKETPENEFDMLKQIEKIADKKDVQEKVKKLSARQLDVLRLIAKGQSNKQIAYELKLTEGTVKLHVTAILKLLNVYNRTGAVTAATQLGLLKGND